MRISRLVLAIIGAAISLPACATSSQSAFGPLRTAPASMAIGPDASNLLYVAAGTFLVQVFSYPSGKPRGSLGVSGYLCSDQSGNVFVAGGEGLSYVWVFPHGGGEPIATLYNPQSPGGCSVDKNSESLAVADTDASSVVVFPYNRKRGWTLARQYDPPYVRLSAYCSYDPKGNLFFDGYSTGGPFILVRMLKGRSKFTTITLNQAINSPGSIQWNGKDLAIEDAGATRSSEAVIYQFAISGTRGHKVSATTLRNSAADGQFLIDGSTVIGPLSYSSGHGIGFWRFPSGNGPIMTIPTYGYASGEALSLK